MNIEEARKWLLDYAKANNNEVLEYNIENAQYPNQIWREYATRRAAQEGLTLVDTFAVKEAETVEEVHAARLAKKLFGFAQITSQGIVYYPDWLTCNDNKFPVRYAVAEPAEAFLRRYGKLADFVESLSEAERELLQKLV